MNYILYRNLKNLFKRLTQLILLALCIGVLASIYSCITQQPPLEFKGGSIKDFREPPEIKVLLAATLNKPSFTLAVNSDFTITPHNTPDVIIRSGPISSTAVAASPKGLLFGKTLLPHQDVDIRPDTDGSIIVNNRAYRGKLWVHTLGDDKLAFCNMVDLEVYLQSVVGSELNPSYPLQALIAQAIAARTYALYEVKSAKYAKRWFDLYDDTSSQAYYGTANEAPRTVSAVQQSRGVVLIYNGGLFKAFYHSTCGGYTESVKDIFGEDEILPLKGRKCDYCEISKVYEWNAAISKQDLAQILLNAKKITSGWVDRIEIPAVLPSGRARTLRLFVAGDTPHSFDMPADDFRGLLGSTYLKSTYFIRVEDLGHSFRFWGKGYGHGVGMCQMGAVGMAESAIGAIDILKYYYPLAELAKIYQ